MIIGKIYFIRVQRDGRAILMIEDGDRVLATLDMGDAMNATEHIARLACEAETNTRMGTAEHNQKRKIKAIRKAMGFTS